MRRQARISGGGALVVRSASALQVWLWLLIFIFQNEFRISRSIQPGYLDFDNLPETNFTCAGKVIGGYYADLETSCQMFHVCTVGQQDEPMDIKFLCLNGTVFDQETRVCERVDEVDCTKSEKFYSLNLELYGSTAPPIIQPEQNKSETEVTEISHQPASPTQNIDPSIDENIYTTTQNKSPEQTHDIPDSTEDPVQDKIEHKYTQTISSTHSVLQQPGNDELTEEYQEEDDSESEYEDYSHAHTTTTETPTTTTLKRTTTSKRITTTAATTTYSPSTSSRVSSPVSYFNSSPNPILSTISPPVPSSLLPSPSVPSAPSAPSVPSAVPLPSLSPTLLSPQEFIYRHRGPGTEAVSYQSFRPADGVYITHAPPQQFDHFQYESSRTAPRPAAPRPTVFAQRPQPSPFRATTLDPRDQILRPGPSSQPSERHETSIKHRQQQKPYPSSLPAQRPLPFNPYYYDRKRSDDSPSEDESSLSARSVAPPTVTEKPPVRLKSPPRVIVTASASVSDSNGKRLNYTVGNVVSAVKPIVPINYDDYKESDLIFDPFFLDVPKLQKRRKTRSNHNRRIFTVPATATVSSELSHNKVTAAPLPITSRATTTDRSPTTPNLITTTTTGWNPNDYVDDNYEPHAYVPPIPPLAVLVSQDIEIKKLQNRKSNNNIHGYDNLKKDKAKASRTEHLQMTTESSELNISSQRKKAEIATVASPPSPPPLEASLRAS